MDLDERDLLKAVREGAAGGPALAKRFLDHRVKLTAVAAIVEEANHLIYSVGKARISTLLEAMLGKSNIGSDPAGKLLTYTLEELQRLVIEAAQRHVPGLTVEMLDEVGATRERVTASQDRFRLVNRVRRLRRELDAAEQDLAELPRPEGQAL